MKHELNRQLVQRQEQVLKLGNGLVLSVYSHSFNIEADYNNTPMGVSDKGF